MNPLPLARCLRPLGRTVAVAVYVFLFSHVAVAETNYPNIVEDPPLSPQEQQKKFHLPPGFEIQLVAAEPEVHKPMNFNFDAAGRLWFTGSVEYPFPKPEDSPARDTLRIIHGFNPGGSATKITTFADNLNIPIGVTPISTHEAICFSVPYEYRLTDADGDGVAEKREKLFGPFGQRDTHGLNNSFTYSIDGWIYACHGYVNSSPVQGTDGQSIQLEGGNVYRFRPDGSHIEFFTHGQVNPFGLAFDPLGNLFSADCHTLPAYLLLRGAYYPSFGKPHDGIGFGPQIMKHSHGSTGIAGIVCYHADQFPAEYQNNLFIGNPITHRVNHDKLVAHGSSYEAVEQPDFVTCDDPWFRPVELKLGPDGALYIGDFYNCIIGHYEVPLDHPKRDRERGRIWRVVYKGSSPSLPPGEDRGESASSSTVPDISEADANQLVDLLADNNITVRTLATNELVNRIGKPCVSVLRERMKDSHSVASQRAHGLWVLERLNDLDDHSVQRLLNDSDRTVRIQIIHALAEREKSTPSLPIANLVREKLSDEDAFVRRAAVDCLGRHPEQASMKPLLDLWRAAPADDSQLIHTARMAIRDHLKRPEILSAVARRDSKINFSDDQRGQLAELCLGIPSPRAADLALEYVKSKPDAFPDFPSALSPLLQHVSPAHLDEVYELALSFQKRPEAKKPADERTEGDPEQILLIGLARAAQARGITLPASIKNWGQKLAADTLATKKVAAHLIGIELAREMHLQEAQPRIAEIALKEINSDARIDAIMTCVTLDGPASVETFNKILTNNDEQIALRQRAARCLGTVNNDAARESLLKFLATAPERLAVEIATSLSKSKPGGESLLAAISAGKASPRLLQEPTIADSLSRQKIENLADQIAKLTASLPSRDEQLRNLIEDRLTRFEQAKPDHDRGKQIFTKNCAVCHKLGGEGVKVGPELDGIGVRGPSRIMEDILDPNRNVDQNFRTTTLTTTDGKPLSGLVVREEGKVLVLVDNAGKEQRVAADEIEPGTREVSVMSPMPANLRDAIPEEDFYQLIAYLLEQKPK